MLKHPEIWPSNAFIGNYLRLKLLERAGRGRQILDETKGYFTYMAEQTGTLWENDTTSASCNHGFASYAAVLLVHSVLGVEVDHLKKTVTVRPTDVDLAFCGVTLPVPGGEIAYDWVKKGGRREETFAAPPGWRLVHAVSAAALGALFADDAKPFRFADVVPQCLAFLRLERFVKKSFQPPLTARRSYGILCPRCTRGEIGIHARFRFLCRKVCGFDSHRVHQVNVAPSSIG